MMLDEAIERCLKIAVEQSYYQTDHKNRLAKNIVADWLKYKDKPPEKDGLYYYKRASWQRWDPVHVFTVLTEDDTSKLCMAPGNTGDIFSSWIDELPYDSLFKPRDGSEIFCDGGVSL